MPTYDYHCAANDRTVQVAHRMSHDVTTWGELCTLASIDAGTTAAAAPVTKIHLATGRMERMNVGSDSRGGSAYGAGTTTKAYHNTKNFEARE